MSSKEVRASTIDTFRRYGQWLEFQIPKIKTAYFIADDLVKRKLNQGYQRITQILKFPEKIPKEKLTPEPITAKSRLLQILLQIPIPALL